MPIIILGLIVILGGALLIFYQLGPKVSLRLKGSGIFGGFGGGESAGADEGAAEPYDADAMAGEDAGEAGADAEPVEIKPTIINDDGVPRHDGKKPAKVIYVYGDGEIEERSLRDNDGSPEEE